MAYHEPAFRIYSVLAWHRHDNHAFYNKRLSRHHHNHPVSGNRIQDNILYIAMHIIVAYGVSILTVAENLVDNVKYKVEEFTGMEVGKIIVCVEDVKVVN